MTNKDIVDLVFNKIKVAGFKSYNITHPDGYFMYEGEKDSVTHFRLKGRGMWKHWKFGLWVNAEYMTKEDFDKADKRHENADYDNDPKVIQLFAQYDTQINKFKPSRSALLFEVDNVQLNEYLNDNHEYLFYQLNDMLSMMVRHPFMCYSEYCGRYAGYADYSFIGEFIVHEGRVIYRKAKKFLQKSFWLPYTKVKIALCKRSPVVHDIVLNDFEKNNPGWSTNYLYEVQITFTEDATNDQMIDWLNTWWKHTEYGVLGYDCIVEIGLFHQIGEDGRGFTFSKGE